MLTSTQTHSLGEGEIYQACQPLFIKLDSLYLSSLPAFIYQVCQPLFINLASLYLSSLTAFIYQT